MKSQKPQKGKNKDVLFVDDEPSILEVVREFFKLVNIQASFAKDGYEAIGLCRKYKFDVIFIDYFMPGKDGIETASEIRALEPDAYIVIISGWWPQFNKDEFAFVNKIIGKPFQMSSLVDIIKEAKNRKINEPAKLSKTTYKFNIWNLNIIGKQGLIAFIGLSDTIPSKILKRCEIIDEPDLLFPFTSELDEYLQGKRREFSHNPLFLFGTEFQKFIWNNLRKIPYGETISYSDFAVFVGLDKKYARAIGNACSQNPVPIIVPCHRVIMSDGSIGGYSEGVELKRFLLEHEKKNSAK